MARPNWAILDRFSLGLLEGVLLPAAIAGVSSTTITIVTTNDAIFANDATITTTLEGQTNFITENNPDIKATASAISHCNRRMLSRKCMGLSLSAWIIFSETSQLHLAQWGLLQHDSTTSSSVWPLLFYMSSKSGRTIIAAQIGQGALLYLYSIASWGPLYLEQIADVSTTTADAPVDASSSSFVSSTAVAASIAASSLLVPQITQALIGMSIAIGVGADKRLKFLLYYYYRRESDLDLQSDP